MPQSQPPFLIGIAIYPGVDLLDVAAPYEMFNWMKTYWKDTRDVQVLLVAQSCGVVKTRDGLTFLPQATFAEVPRLDLIWVPGADPDALWQQMQNAAFMAFLRDRSAGARYVCSVCEGALLLAYAGLLDGCSATTHWAFIPCLKKFPAITVEADHPRFVVDDRGGAGRGVRVTGGGISSGLDEALELIKRISGEDVAKQVQVVTQYFPRPPVSAEIPGADQCPMAELST